MKGKLHMRKRKNERAPVNALVIIDPKTERGLLKHLRGVMSLLGTKSHTGAIKYALIRTLPRLHADLINETVGVDAK